MAAIDPAGRQYNWPLRQETNHQLKSGPTPAPIPLHHLRIHLKFP